ncbi:hypothetical protein LOAG_04185 [Loa loa]|uniref:Uncharacterized protein n=1 Tax=Loa loa TaxID=7209 RepID=A0A1S0U4K8_LOALO|nr:hypothetical protein LOAG_04185 [Loa loa]EFO24298.1 hypothetical protein LOAG_04185 [Loa loa]
MNRIRKELSRREVKKQIPTVIVFNFEQLNCDTKGKFRIHNFLDCINCSLEVGMQRDNFLRGLVNFVFSNPIFQRFMNVFISTARTQVREAEQYYWHYLESTAAEKEGNEINYLQQPRNAMIQRTRDYESDREVINATLEERVGRGEEYLKGSQLVAGWLKQSLLMIAYSGLVFLFSTITSWSS